MYSGGNRGAPRTRREVTLVVSRQDSADREQGAGQRDRAGGRRLEGMGEGGAQTQAGHLLTAEGASG